MPPSAFPDYPDGYTLTTPRLVLRAPTPMDAFGMFPLMADARLTDFLAWHPHQTIDETRSMVEALGKAQAAHAGFHWIAIDKEQVVGLVSLIDVRWTHRSWTLDRAELAYWVGTRFQGGGYATEMARAALDFGFAQLKLHKIRVYHAADNPASGRTIQKLAFRFVGEEKDAFQKAGTWHDLRHYEMLASDYLPETHQ